MANLIINNKGIQKVFAGIKEIFNICKGSEQIWQNFKAIDLGLPSGTLWADRNLGAKRPEDYGGEYAWGTTTTSKSESWNNYICSEDKCGTEKDPLIMSNLIYKDIDNEYFGDISGREKDITHKEGNNNWRLPTCEEVDELLKYCETSQVFKTVDNGDNTTTDVLIGIKLTGLNNNSIFLPILDKESDVINEASIATSNIKHGYYWSGTINSGNPKQAYSFVFKSDDVSTTTAPSIGMCVTSRFRHLAIRPVSKFNNDDIINNAIDTPTIKFIDPETDSEITSPVELYKGESKSLYFEIYPETSSVKKVHFDSSSNYVTVTNTGYITVDPSANISSTTVTATLPNGRKAECTINIKNQIPINKIILNDKNNQPITESSTNTISITLNEWESKWIVPSLINADNSSEGIIDKKLKWQVVSGTGNVFIVPLHDMSIYWDNTVPENFDCHPVKIFGLAAGTAQIKITASNDPSKIKYINVTVTSANTKKCNGHTFVDLGTSGSNYWSTENVGALNYNEYGNYYAFGDVSTKATYTIDNYQPDPSTAAGNVVYLGEEIYNTKYDAAYKNWGGHWRMPSYQEFKLLSTLNDACIKIGNITYVLKMGLHNDNFILIPKNGYWNTKINDKPYNCYYWSSTSKITKQPTSNSDKNIVYEYCTGYRNVNYTRLKGGVENGCGIRPIYTFEAPLIECSTNMYNISYPWSDSSVTIYYTVDGTDPKINGNIYSTSIDASLNNIRAVAKDSEGNYSEEAASQYIDLGLPSGIKWCTHNIGASTYKDTGSFYGLSKQTSQGISGSTIKVNTALINSGSFCGNSNCDPATKFLGSDYCTPTFEDFEELVENCSFIYTKLNNGKENEINIYKVIGPNGNHIYLPFGTTKTSGNTTGESQKEITLMISDHINLSNSKLTNGYVKFNKTYRASADDANIFVHNLNTEASIESNTGLFHIRPIYGKNINNIMGSPQFRNNTKVNTVNHFPIIHDDNTEHELVGSTSSLTDILHNSWSQIFPSGIIAPKYKFNGGSHYGAGGCMAMAGCQTMWYHKWPVVKKHENDFERTYRWNCCTGNSGPSGWRAIFVDATGKIFPLTYRESVKNYTVNKKRIYHYNNIPGQFFTCIYQNKVAATPTNIIYPSYDDKRKGSPYTSVQANEYGKILLDFAQLMYNPSESYGDPIHSLQLGPYETVGNATDLNKSMQTFYQYSRKQFYMNRTTCSREIFEEIVQDSLNNYMPITADSHGHEWMITGYDASSGNYYINMNEGDASSRLQDIDNIKDDTKEYSHVYIDSSGNTKYSYAGTAIIGIAPNCVKQLKDYFMMYASTTYRSIVGSSGSKAVSGYSTYINKTPEEYAEDGYTLVGTNIEFGKNDIFTIKSAVVAPKGNAVPERVFIALCLEKENSDLIILKKIWYTPIFRGSFSNGGSITVTITPEDNISFTDIPEGEYELTLRYSKNDGQTYSERVILPDTRTREILKVTVTDTTVTITPDYKEYGS